MNKLERSSSLHEIVSTLNSLIDETNNNAEVLKTLDNSYLGEKVKYTSTATSLITGEVFVVAIPGMYKFKATGSGVANMLLQKKGSTDIFKKIDLYSEEESEEFLLGSGDKILFYITSGSSFSISLYFTQGLFAAVEKLLGEVNTLKQQSN